MICKGLRGRSILSLIRRLVFESRSKLIEQLSFAFSHGLNPPAKTPKNELNPPAVFRQDQTNRLHIYGECGQGSVWSRHLPLPAGLCAR